MGLYDIIGDIHGHAEPLERLLTKLGYRQVQGVWEHPTRRVIFVGDFIDRGPHQKAVVEMVQAMTQRGSALAVMGNHEFNAVAYDTPDPDDPHRFLRPHSTKNQRQHQAFLNAYADDPVGKQRALDWFRTLPFFLERDGVRVVHATWHETSKQVLEAFVGLTPALVLEASQAGSPAHGAIEIMLKGLEARLPEGHHIEDKDGHRRGTVRLRWWDTEAKDLGEAAFSPPGDGISAAVRKLAVPDNVERGYPAEAPPVFFGHYWLRGEPRSLASNVVCLDYSVAKGGRLVAAQVDQGRLRDFTWVDAA